MCFPCCASKPNQLPEDRARLMIVNANPNDKKSRDAALRAARKALGPKAPTAPGTLANRSIAPNRTSQPHTT